MNQRFRVQHLNKERNQPKSTFKASQKEEEEAAAEKADQHNKYDNDLVTKA